MKEIKKHCHSNFTLQKAKIAPQNQNIFLPTAGYKPRFAQEIIAKLLCDDNSNAVYHYQGFSISPRGNEKL